MWRCVQQGGKNISLPCLICVSFFGRGRVWVQRCTSFLPATAHPTSPLCQLHILNFKFSKESVQWTFINALYLNLPIFSIFQQLFYLHALANMYACVFVDSLESQLQMRFLPQRTFLLFFVKVSLLCCVVLVLCFVGFFWERASRGRSREERVNPKQALHCQ